MMQVHASAVAIGAYGVLIRGASGRGKSDLVLRLLDSEGFGLGTQPLRAKLIADDQVFLTEQNNQLLLKPPPALAGKLEIRGRGIVECPWVENIALALVVDLVPFKDIERMPEDDALYIEFLSYKFPHLMIDPSQASACARIRSFPFHLA
jgi:HPr kinase/phosphorylase